MSERGDRVTSGSEDKTARVRGVKSGEWISEPLAHLIRVLNVMGSGEGNSLRRLCRKRRGKKPTLRGTLSHDWGSL